MVIVYPCAACIHAQERVENCLNRKKVKISGQPIEEK